MARQSKSMISNNSNVAYFTSQDQWCWPVPLLFEGLADMLVLVAFALTILTCSTGKLSVPRVMGRVLMIPLT